MLLSKLVLTETFMMLLFLIMLPPEPISAQTTPPPIETQADLGTMHMAAPAKNLPIIKSVQQLYVTIRNGSSSSQDCAVLHDCFNSEVQMANIGQTVNWYNDDSASHTVTSGRPSDSQSGTIFDSGLIEPRGQFSFTFKENGTYNYFCKIHPWMSGVVLVGVSQNGTSVSNENVKHAILNATGNSTASINDAITSQAIAAEVDIINQTLQTRSIDHDISVYTHIISADSISIDVSASTQTSPKVILVNLTSSKINLSDLNYLAILYDGNPIASAPNIDAVLHAKSSDNPSFVIIGAQSKAQILVLIPHFSTHTITITNLSKIISPVPEFPLVIVPLVITLIFVLILARNSAFRLSG